MASLGDLIVRVGANIGEFESSMSTVSGRLDQVAKDADNAFKGFDRIGQQMAAMGASLTAAITLPLAGVGLASIQAAGQMEQAAVGFKTLLGSAQAAGQMLDQLKTFALTTPFNFPELVTAAQRLMAMGTAAKDVIPVMTSIGNAVSAMGKGMPEFDRLALAFSQMSNSAKLSAQDMRQFTEAGVGAWKYLSQATGIAANEIQEKAKDVLTGAQAAQIILQGMSKDFNGAMIEQSKTMLGMWSNVQDALKFTFADIGKALLPLAKQITTDFIIPMLDGLKGLAEWFGNLPTPVQDTVIAIAAMAAAAGPLLLAIGGISLGFGALMTGIAAFGGAATALAGTIGTVAFAVTNGLTGALTGAEAMVLRFGQAAVLAGTAFAAWELGKWAYANVPGVKALGDAIGDLVLKIPGVQAFIDKQGGLTAANDQLAASTQRLSGWLKDHGVVVERGNQTLDQWAAAVSKTAQEYIKMHPELAKNASATTQLSEAQKQAAANAELNRKAVEKYKTELTQAQAVLAATKALFDQHKATQADVAAATSKVEEAQVRLTTAQKSGADAASSLSEAQLHHRDTTNYLAKAKQDLESAESALAAAYKSIYIPVITDVAEAEGKVSAARQAVITATDNVKAAEERLAAVVKNSPGDTAALKKGTEDLDAARKSLKNATDNYATAEQDLAQTKQITTQAANDLKSADQAYSDAIKSTHVPMVKDYASAIGDVKKAKEDVEAAAANMLKSEQALATLLSGDGVKSAKDIQDAQDKLNQTRTTLKGTIDNLRQAEKDLAASEGVTKRATDELNKGERALEEFYRSHYTVTIKNFRQALDDVRKAKNDAAKAADNLKTAEQNLESILKAEKSSTGDVAKATGDAEKARDDFKTTTERLVSTERSLSSEYGVSKRALNDITGSENSAKTAAENLEAAMSALGLTSAASLREIADHANDVYTAMESAGNDYEKRDALIKVLEAEKAAMQAAGGDLTREQQATLDTLLAQEAYFKLQHDTLIPAWKQSWVDAIKDINHAITNDLSKGISDVITGAGNIADAFKKMGRDVVDIIVNHVIAEALKPLLSKLDDVLQKIGDIIAKWLGWGSASKKTPTPDIPSGGSDSGGDDTSIPSIPQTGGGGDSGGGDGGDGGGDSGGGVMGVVNMISGVVTAISSVIGNFQMAKQETSLNAIEHNTRYSMMYLGERSDGGILKVLFNIDEHLQAGYLVKAVEDFRNKFWDTLPLFWERLDAIVRNTAGGVQATAAPAAAATEASAPTVVSGDALPVLEKLLISVESHGGTISSALAKIANTLTEFVKMFTVSVKGGEDAPRPTESTATPTWVSGVVAAINLAGSNIVKAIDDLVWGGASSSVPSVAGYPGAPEVAKQADGIPLGSGIDWRQFGTFKPPAPEQNTDQPDPKSSRQMQDTLNAILKVLNDGLGAVANVALGIRTDAAEYFKTMSGAVVRVVDAVSKALVPLTAINSSIMQLGGEISAVGKALSPLALVNGSIASLKDEFGALLGAANDTLREVVTEIKALPHIPAAQAPALAGAGGGGGGGDTVVNVNNPTILDSRTTDALARRVVDTLRRGSGRI